MKKGGNVVVAIRSTSVMCRRQVVEVKPRGIKLEGKIG